MAGATPGDWIAKTYQQIAGSSHVSRDKHRLSRVLKNICKFRMVWTIGTGRSLAMYTKEALFPFDSMLFELSNIMAYIINQTYLARVKIKNCLKSLAERVQNLLAVIKCIVCCRGH